MKTIKIITIVLASIAFTVTTIAQTVPSYVPTNGLVGYWGFNGNANDESGNSNNGTVYGAILTTDRFGNANSSYDFQNNIIVIPHNPLLGFRANSGFTVSIWCDRSRLTDVFHLIGKRANYSPTFNWQIAFSDGPNFGSGTGVFYNGAFSSDSLLINMWYHIVGKFDNGLWSIYINGVLKASNKSAILYPDIITPITIGNSGSYQPFYGKLDDIAIYNRALTQAEITQLYTANFTPVPMASAQTFCGGATVASLTADGTKLKWYATETETIPLAPSEVLTIQTYYVSQTLRGTESSRTAVAVTIAPATSAIVVTNFVSLPSVDIGLQTWTVKNLDVATYSDGTIIPQVTDPTQWANLTTGAWCYYNNSPSNGVVYGKLYNWYAVAGIYNEASKTDLTLRKKLAPTGYHVPSDVEWTKLINYLGGLSVAGGKMKETSSTHWNSPNTSATNSSGLTCLPGGYRSFTGAFVSIGYFSHWWSTSEFGTTGAFGRNLYYNNSTAGRDFNDKPSGFSVRCIRD